jgi:purine-cytosine permease-like protein
MDSFQDASLPSLSFRSLLTIYRCVLLNIVIELGYGVVDCLVAGLILSAVSGGGMTVIVGIVIVALITWVVSTFGIKSFHKFESYIWAPTVLILFM